IEAARGRDPRGCLRELVRPRHGKARDGVARKSFAREILAGSLLETVGHERVMRRDDEGDAHGRTRNYSERRVRPRMAQTSATTIARPAPAASASQSPSDTQRFGTNA